MCRKRPSIRQSALKIPTDTAAAVYSAARLPRKILDHRYVSTLVLILVAAMGYPANAQNTSCEFEHYTIADGLPTRYKSSLI